MNTSFIPRDRKHDSIANEGRRPAPGFTLMEILIAIALIVTITAVAVTSLTGLLKGGEEKAAYLFVRHEISTPLLAYKLDTGDYPTTDQGLKALIVKPDGVSGWKGPYLQETVIPLDPWNKEYNYVYPGVHRVNGYDCWSSGEDKISGNADDIGNW